MFTKNGKVYAEAWHILRHRQSGQCAAQAAGAAADYEEVPAPTADMHMEGVVAVWAGGMCRYAPTDLRDYARIKTRLIKQRYTNDDQLAIMLNVDPDEMRRMQLWREWAAEVARKITNL